MSQVAHQESLSSRMGAVILLGSFLSLAAFPLLFWNEGRAVKTVRELREGVASVAHVSEERVDPAREVRPGDIPVHTIASDAEPA